MRNGMKRVLGFALSLMLVAGMLPVSVLAAEPCTHEELIKGVCQNESCGEKFAAAVGDTLYTELEAAIAAAEALEDPAVTVLTDLSDVNLTLGKVYLMVQSEDWLTFENCSFTGGNADQIILNRGKLILENVAVKNTVGSYAVYAECTEGSELQEMTILGGTYSGQAYGFGLKQMQLQLNAHTTETVNEETQEPETVSAVPEINGETAALYLDDSVIEVLCDLGEASYAVERTTPGVVAIATEYADVELKENWFTQEGLVFRESRWVLPEPVQATVTLDKTEVTYNGSVQTPNVTVQVEDNTLTEGTDYTVSYTKDNQPVDEVMNAGTYTVIVKAKENGSYAFDDVTATFEIKKADAAALTISGQPAAVTYGDQPFRLTASGGISGAQAVWSVTEGSSIASVAEDGTVTVNGAGNVTVKLSQDGDANHNAQSAEYTFAVQPAVLTVDSVTVENKLYDGTKTVTVTDVALKGVYDGDTVSVAVNNLKGELADSKAGIYTQVTLGELTLTGEDAAKYTLTQPAGAVKADVSVTKAELKTALAEIKATVATDVTEVTVENLGAGMPADAGALSYAALKQDTVDGTEAIVLDWKVDSNGKLTSKVVGGKKGDQVIYEVTVSSENYRDTVVRVTVAYETVKLDSEKLTVTPAESKFTYDGKAHKPAVEVKYDGVVLKDGTDYEVSYPADTVNAGEKELTVTFKGNYTGSATAKYTVEKAKLTVTGVQAENKTYDGTTKATVTATFSGAVSGDDVKVTAAGVFADKNSGSSKTINVSYALTGNDAGNYELTSSTGTTTAKISPVTASSLNSQISGLTVGNADSGNKYTLQNVVSKANAALEDSGLSSSERSAISNVKWTAEDMIRRIDSAASAAATESIRKSADITKENVTLADQPLLEKAQSDLNSALTTYSGNYTTAEETTIGNSKTRIAEALTVITRVQSAQTMIGALPAQFTEETMVDPAVKNTVEDAKTAFDALSNYEKTLLGEDAQLKLTAAVEALDRGVTNDAAVEDVIVMASGVSEEDEGFKFPVWILIVAVVAAGACGVGLFLYKRKQEENEYNW